jgi:hypothetical protein
MRPANCRGPIYVAAAMWLAFGSGKARGASNIGSDTERGRGLNSESAPSQAGGIRRGILGVTVR